MGVLWCFHTLLVEEKQHGAIGSQKKRVSVCMDKLKPFQERKGTTD